MLRLVCIPSAELQCGSELELHCCIAIAHRDPRLRNTMAYGDPRVFRCKGCLGIKGVRRRACTPGGAQCQRSRHVFPA